MGKEEIQKFVLAGILLVGLLYCYFALLLGPLSTKRATAHHQIDEIRGKITEAKKQISRTNALEASAPQHALAMKQITANLPEGSPVAWFPTRVAEFFKGYNVDKATTRLNNETAETQITGFRNTTWGVEFPKADYSDFGQALAAFENENYLAEISSLQVDALKEDVESQHVTMTLNHLVK